MSAKKKEKEPVSLFAAPDIKKSKPPKGKKPKTEEQQALDKLISGIEKSYGRGSVMMMSDSPRTDLETVSSCSIGLNIALGVGGYPKGRVIELFGPESSGKTTLALHAIAEVQKAGGRAAIIDAEHALDVKYAANLGVNVDELLLCQPDYGEQGLNICEDLIRSGMFGIVVIDSIPALTPKAEVEGEMGQSHVGLLPRMMSQACRKLAAATSQTQTLLIMINQMRMKIGVMFGNPETTPGGRALRHAYTVRVDIRQIGKIKDGDKILGASTRAKVVKNKVAPPFQQAEFDIMFGKGINRFGEILDFGVTHDLIEKAGSWYSFENEKIGQGRAKAVIWLEENPSVADIIEELIMDAIED